MSKYRYLIIYNFIVNILFNKINNMIIMIYIEQKINYYRSTFYLVFEFCEHNLAALLSNDKLIFDLEEIKQVLKQMLKGLYYIHAKKVKI